MFNWLKKWLWGKIIDEVDTSLSSFGSDSHALQVRMSILGWLHGNVTWFRERYGKDIQSDEQADRFIDRVFNAVPEAELKAQAREWAVKICDSAANVKTDDDLHALRVNAALWSENILTCLGGDNSTGDRAKL